MSRPSATGRRPVDIPALEVGGTHVTAGWVRPEGWQVSGVSRAELPAGGTAEQLIAALARAGAGLEAEPGAAWGIAIPGPFDYVRGVAHYTGVGTFEALAGVDVRSALHQALPHQPGSLYFSNDASAFLVGEWLIGAARGATRCVAVTLGAGVGSAFLDRGNVIDTGSSVPPQAELRLLSHAGRPLEDWVSRRAIRAAFTAACGRDGLDDASAFLVGEWLIGAARGATRCVAVTLGAGVGSAFLDRGNVIDTGSSVPPQAELRLLSHAGRPLEDWVSRRAIRAAFTAAGGRDGLDDVDVREIAELARAGDQAAAAAFQGAFAVLGEVLGPWLERFGADLLVLGGSLSQAWDLIERPLRSGLSRCSDWRFSIETAGSPELSPLVGAAYPALRPTS